MSSFFLANVAKDRKIHSTSRLDLYEMRRKELRKDRNLVRGKFKMSKTRFISFQEKKKKQLQRE